MAVFIEHAHMNLRFPYNTKVPKIRENDRVVSLLYIIFYKSVAMSTIIMSRVPIHDFAISPTRVATIIHAQQTHSSGK